MPKGLSHRAVPPMR